MAFSVCKDTTFSTTPPNFWAKKVILVNGKFSEFRVHLLGIKENALLRQTAEGAWGKAPKNFIKKKNIKKQAKI